MPGATVAASPAAGFTRADLTTFCRLDELGLEVTGQSLEPGRAVLACRVLEPGQWCRRWRQDTTLAAEPRAKLSCRGLRWALEAIVARHLTVARIAEGLSVAWNTANDAEDELRHDP